MTRVAALLALAPLLATAAEPTEAQLQYACKAAIEQQLHDPTDARLDWTTAPTSRRKDGTYVVDVAGRARNAQGQLRRGTFRCILRATGADDFTILKLTVR